MLHYTLSLTLAWGLFLLLYRLLLRRETFAGWNRAYLLTTLLAGLLLPLAPSPFAAAPVPEAAGAIWLQVLEIGVPDPHAQTTGGWTFYWWWLYAAGCALALVRRLREGFHLTVIYREGRRESYENVTLVYHPHVAAPCSGFGKIFLPAAFDLASAEGQAVFRHEHAHLRLRHGLDLVLLELLGLALWWHPLWYGYRLALREVHELQADRAVLAHTSRQHYGRMLLVQALAGAQPALINGFESSPLKFRIVMMSKTVSTHRARWKYVLVLPVLALLAVACGDNGTEGLTGADAAPATPISGYQVDTLVTVDPATGAETTEFAYKEFDQMPVFGSCPDKTDKDLQQCSVTNLVNHLLQNVLYPRAAREAGLQGMIVVEFVVGEDGRVKGSNIKKGLSPEMDAAVQAIVNDLPPFQPAEINNQPVAVSLVLPVHFQLPQTGN